MSNEDPYGIPDDGCYDDDEEDFDEDDDDDGWIPN